MNNHSRSNRAARRVRVAQSLSTLLREQLQEAEAELYIDGYIRNVNEANALTTASTALNELDERLVNLVQLLSDLRKCEESPQLTEFDSLADMAKQEGIFRDSK